MIIIINQFRPVDDPAGRLVPEEVQLSVVMVMVMVMVLNSAYTGPLPRYL